MNLKKETSKQKDKDGGSPKFNPMKLATKTKSEVLQEEFSPKIKHREEVDKYIRCDRANNKGETRA